MKYNKLGNTELSVSEIGLSVEYLENHSAEECAAVISRAHELGVNLLDCWVSEPQTLKNIGAALSGQRDSWIIQGHIGSIWEDGEYRRSRDMAKVRPAFEAMMAALGTDHVEIGMIHYVDEEKEWKEIVSGEFLAYVQELKEQGIIGRIGMSTHNPLIAREAAESGIIEVLTFSVNPAYDLLGPTASAEELLRDIEDNDLSGVSPERSELYKYCAGNGIAITVMKPFAGGRLFDKETSQFGIAFTPVHCIHYALTRPGMVSVLCGLESVEQVEAAVHYEDADSEEKNYGLALAGAPKHAYANQCMYCGHCKPCMQHIDIPTVNKLYDLAVMYDKVPASIKKQYKALRDTAGYCRNCRTCESRCPFGLIIPDRMKMALKLFRC